MRNAFLYAMSALNSIFKVTSKIFIFISPTECSVYWLLLLLTTDVYVTTTIVLKYNKICEMDGVSLGLTFLRSGAELKTLCLVRVLG